MARMEASCPAWFSCRVREEYVACVRNCAFRVIFGACWWADSELAMCPVEVESEGQNLLQLAAQRASMVSEHDIRLPSFSSTVEKQFSMPVADAYLFEPLFGVTPSWNFSTPWRERDKLRVAASMKQASLRDQDCLAVAGPGRSTGEDVDLGQLANSSPCAIEYPSTPPRKGDVLERSSNNSQTLRRHWPKRLEPKTLKHAREIPRSLSRHLVLQSADTGRIIRKASWQAIQHGDKN